MTPLESVLLILIGRSTALRHALQRWALRYSARLLVRLGPAHRGSAELLATLGAIHGGDTMVGRPIQLRPPAWVTIPPMPNRRAQRSAR